MKNLLRTLLSITLLVVAIGAVADARVFELTNPHPEEVLAALQKTYGDKVHADLVQQRLVVVGSKQQLDEISALLMKLDPAPLALRLIIREQPPSDEAPGTITYSSNNSGYTIDTVEGALIALDYREFAQQIAGAGTNDNNGGWWVVIENSPTQVQSLTLQVRVMNGRTALMLVSYAKEENQQRRVFGNTVSGDLGRWIPLLPQSEQVADDTISSGPKRGSQLFVQIQKRLNKRTR